MKDSVIFGSGNSRYLKSVADFKTLYPTYDDFAAALVAGTLPVDFNGINPAGFQQVGDALGKATFLKDTTAALYGLSESAVPDDAFQKLSTAQTKTILVQHIPEQNEDVIFDLTQIDWNKRVFIEIEPSIGPGIYSYEIHSNGATTTKSADMFSTSWGGTTPVIHITGNHTEGRKNGKALIELIAFNADNSGKIRTLFSIAVSDYSDKPISYFISSSTSYSINSYRIHGGHNVTGNKFTLYTIG